MTNRPQLTPEEMEKLMSDLYEGGCDPLSYIAYCAYREGFDTPSDEIIDDTADAFREFRGVRAHHNLKENKNTLEESRHKTLRLKIQMKGVTKPPMWRQVEVPADFDFEQLNDVIQISTGMEHAHLWQFQEKAYDNGLLIGVSIKDQYGFGIEDVTHEASETCIYSLLHDKGDKLEYTYDFGDDWIFTIKVEEVTDRKGDTPELMKWKCDLQVIEDCGGPWSYANLREALNPNFPKKELKTLPFYGWYESPNEYLEWLEGNLIDPEDVNDALAKIK